MHKVIKSKTTKIIICIIVNVILLIILYNIPIKSDTSFNLCLHKAITGKECWNCGMTRAFLSILHLDFKGAIQYNNKCIIVFPLIVCIYIHWWYKIIFKKENYKES